MNTACRIGILIVAIHWIGQTDFVVAQETGPAVAFPCMANEPLRSHFEILNVVDIGTRREHNRTDVSSLAGKPIRLNIYLKDANLYSFQFR